MQNPIARSMNGALAQSVRAENGVKELGAILNITRMTAATLLNIRLAAIQAFDLWNRANDQLAGNRDELDVRIDQARLLVMVGRDLLKPTFGTRHNPKWPIVGFPKNLSVPKDPDALLVMVRAMAAFYAAHPDFQKADSNITAAAFQLHYDGLVAAIGVVDRQEGVVTTLVQDRDKKFAAVRKSIRDLIKELSTILDPLDGRWKTFGFNMPGARSIPSVPADVSVRVVGHDALVQWNSSERADYYRVFKRVLGVDKEFVPVSSQNGLDAVVPGLPGNAEIELAVSAVNNGGESMFSAVVAVKT
jgi:hypothetical protein